MNYRQHGIGKSLLTITKEKAIHEGYTELSLIVFSDNTSAINFYHKNQFESVKHIDVAPHRLIPHEGGCILMKCLL